MTNKEKVTRNIGLTFDLIRAIIDDPSITDNFPARCEIEFIEKDFPLLKKHLKKHSKLIKVKNILEIV